MKTTNLSLAEAHNSGRKYRPVGDHHSIYFRYETGWSLSWFAATTMYELEPEAKLLTREDVRQAVLSTLLPHENIGTVTAFHRAAEICDKLFGEEEEV